MLLKSKFPQKRRTLSSCVAEVKSKLNRMPVTDNPTFQYSWTTQSPSKHLTKGHWVCWQVSALAKYIRGTLQALHHLLISSLSSSSSGERGNFRKGINRKTARIYTSSSLKMVCSLASKPLYYLLPLPGIRSLCLSSLPRPSKYRFKPPFVLPEHPDPSCNLALITLHRNSLEP